MSKIFEKILIEKFKNKEYFTREELFEFYKSQEPDLNEGTFGWRVFNLQHKNVIKPTRRGCYAISFKPKYKPLISAELLKISKILSENFNNTTYSIWSTEWLNEFAQHQSGKKLIIIEVEKQMETSVFYTLRDSLKQEIFITPDEKVIDFYISESKTPVIVKKLITRSPINKNIVNNRILFTPQLEKILVDLYAEDKLLYFYQGSELIHIYENAIKDYTINFTKLLSYAKRREKETEIKQFLKTNMSHLIKNIIE